MMTPYGWILVPSKLLTALAAPLGTIAGLAVYAWIALCLYIIAKKTNTQNAWLAWIPVGNTVLACIIAGKPWWWVFIFFIPIANAVFGLLVMWRICEIRNKPGWLAVLMIVPLANLVIPFVLAFDDSPAHST